MVDVSELADELASAPVGQQRGFVLALLEALERRATDKDAFGKVLQELETDLRQYRAIGRWPGAGHTLVSKQWEKPKDV